jgi:hypothetical protein
MYDGLGSLAEFLTHDDFPFSRNRTRIDSMPQTACSARDKQIVFDSKRRLCSRGSFLNKIKAHEISSKGFDEISTRGSTAYLYKNSPRNVHSLIEQRAKLASQSKPRTLPQSPKDDRPDYSSISCKVNTRRAQTRDKELEALDKYSHKLQERVRNELL